ncbi:uncharacterized protein F4822DRAFT_375222 [Hypoxylon trugodes]|uniref:uncharacterized protein n=1 Tax=Hypoxylon trugodes TaxID=326681 RepID=UPI0021954ADB|nr:uncharacterized protein F4822DRAFT_375222 [Hypoxylon trugodes]KAI1384860.1 hypothetical protein F4822DRAFT_375222 [Hypoxylon trugodes]
MASPIRICRPLSRFATILRQRGPQNCRTLSTAAKTFPKYTTAKYTRTTPCTTSSFHTTAPRRAGDEPPPTDFSALDVFGNMPIPSTAIEVCMPDGFQFNSGIKILDGSGVLLVGGEAFKWQPWLPRGEKRLLNKKGQWEVPNDTFGLLGLLWPRPDLLILGLGPEMRPLSPELRKHISSLGMRVEILDTRNAAAQFNLLATERGVNDVAAALIPIGWKEGIGAT